MFQPNEYVVYGRTGVCLVEGIERFDGRDYYTLHSLYQKCRIQTPVNGKIPMRRLITKDQADALIDSIPSMHVKPVNSRTQQELNEEYRKYLLSQDCRDLILLTMSIYAKKMELQKAKKKLAGADDAYFKEGESLLFGELSIVLGIPITEVQNYIKARINTNKS
jgi:CarD family transcriptional regulator